LVGYFYYRYLIGKLANWRIKSAVKKQ